MRLQSQILHTLRAPEAQARLESIVAHGACQSRAALGREVCAQFGLVDARGSAQLTGCLTALKVLETAGPLTLPAPRPHPQRPSPRCLDAPVPAPVGVPAQVRDVEGLTLVGVEDEAQRRVWNTLLATEHPQGTTTFVGCQVRYLIGSAHSWLGAVGFSASALRLRARDTPPMPRCPHPTPSPAQCGSSPGHQLMWRGYERMSLATLGYRIAEKRRAQASIIQNEWQRQDRARPVRAHLWISGTWAWLLAWSGSSGRSGK